MRRLIRRAWYVIRHRRFEADLAEEIAFHHEMKERELREGGLDAADAGAAARRAVGSVALAQNHSRDVWIWPWLQDIAQDVRFAARLLAKDRRFTLAALVALSLGIAANTTVFTFINTALFKPLPFDQPHQLASLGTRDARGRELQVSYLDFQDWRASTRAFTAIAGHAGSTMNVSEEGRAPARLRGSYISANVFDVLRVKPMLGRAFLPDDERPGAPAVVVIGHGVWTVRYSGDPSVIGRTVKVNDLPSTVVGVTPPGFRFPMTAEVWQPLPLMFGVATAKRDTRTLGVIARLGDSVTMEQARDDLSNVAARLAQQYPDTNRRVTSTVARPMEAVRRFAKPMLLTMMGAVGFVLLIACANVANLLLARAAHRSREIAIRASLGATRWRIVRQLLIESILLATMAGIVGLTLSVYGVRYFGVAFDAMEDAAPDQTVTPYWVDLTMDGLVFAFVAALCLGSSVLFGLAPALHISKTNANDVLKEGGRGAAGSVRSRRWTGALMVTELALTLVLLSGAGLLVRSFVTHYRTNLVVDTSHLATVRMALPIQKYPTPESRKAFFERLDERLASNPVVTSVTIASDIPFASLGGSSRQLSIDGRSPAAGEQLPTVSYVTVGERYFETLGLRLVQGRALTAVDGAPGQEAAVVNQRFVDMFFPAPAAAAASEAESSRPLGHRIRLTNPNTPGPSPSWLTIVGVAPTLPRLGGPPQSAETVVYVPLRAEPAANRFVSVIVRSGSGLAAIAASLREEVRALDPDLPLYFIQTMDEVVARTRYPHRMMGSLFGLLALIALVLASVGLYGLTAHGVTERTQEIGVRIALGAQTRQVVWLFMRRTLVQLAIGLTLGLGGALAVGQLLQSFLIRTSARDPTTMISVAALLVVVSVAASVLPARRAARVDPVVALRCE